MSWNKQFSSRKELEEAKLPLGADSKQYEAAKAAAITILDSGAIPEAPVDDKHVDHEDNVDKNPQATIRISLSGHTSAGIADSIHVSVTQA